jgi:CheY-like chemotaxis protein
MAQRILIVEDEPAFAEVLSELLRDEGYAVIHLSEAFSALNMLNRLHGNGLSKAPDLIVCDVMLPGLRGDRLAAEIRARFPKRRLPILLLSASADPRVSLPDVAFMGKPFETAELLKQINMMLTSVAHT